MSEEKYEDSSTESESERELKSIKKPNCLKKEVKSWFVNMLLQITQHRGIHFKKEGKKKRPGYRGNT